MLSLMIFLLFCLSIFNETIISSKKLTNWKKFVTPIYTNIAGKILPCTTKMIVGYKTQFQSLAKFHLNINYTYKISTPVNFVNCELFREVLGLTLLETLLNVSSKHGKKNTIKKLPL